MEWVKRRIGNGLAFLLIGEARMLTCHVCEVRHFKDVASAKVFPEFADAILQVRQCYNWKAVFGLYSIAV